MYLGGRYNTREAFRLMSWYQIQNMRKIHKNKIGVDKKESFGKYMEFDLVKVSKLWSKRRQNKGHSEKGNSRRKSRKAEMGTLA